MTSAAALEDQVGDDGGARRSLGVRAEAARAWWASKSPRARIAIAGAGIVAVIVVAAAAATAGSAPSTTPNDASALDEGDGLYEIGTATNSSDEDLYSSQECELPAPGCDLGGTANASACAAYSGCDFDQSTGLCLVSDECVCADVPDGGCAALEDDEASCEPYDGCVFDADASICSDLDLCNEDDDVSSSPSTPTEFKTAEPTFPTPEPTPFPTLAPTLEPTLKPTAAPSPFPTPSPSLPPTPDPTPNAWGF